MNGDNLSRQLSFSQQCHPFTQDNGGSAVDSLIYLPRHNQTIVNSYYAQDRSTSSVAGSLPNADMQRFDQGPDRHSISPNENNAGGFFFIYTPETIRHEEGFDNDSDDSWLSVSSYSSDEYISDSTSMDDSLEFSSFEESEDIMTESQMSEDNSPNSSTGHFSINKFALTSESELEALCTERSHSQCCVICLNNWRRGDSVRQLPCFSSHIFHENCLMTWFQFSHTCPVCRSIVANLIL